MVHYTCLAEFWESSDCQYSKGWIYNGCKGYNRFSVNLILKIHGILNVLSSEYAKVLNLSGVQICYSYIGFWIKNLHDIYLTGLWIYHGFKISQGSGYTRVLNMLGFLKKTLHHICLPGFRVFLRFWIWQGSKYVRVTQSSEQYAPL